MLSRLIDGCSIRQAARHVTSIMARRKVENNVTWFRSKWMKRTLRSGFAPVEPVKTGVKQFEKSRSNKPKQSPTVGHFAAVLILHRQF